MTSPLPGAACPQRRRSPPIASTSPPACWFLESLKKPRTGVYRIVPVPPALLENLNMVHGICSGNPVRARCAASDLWPWRSLRSPHYPVSRVPLSSALGG
jgi:hypothetical protein